MEQLIQQAIEGNKLIEFSYGGHLRLAEPHVLGVNDGITQVLAYQVGGSSSTGGIPEWRRFDLPRISGLKVTSTSFPGRRPFSSGKHSSWDQTIAIVA
jgi:predicted DNA-binding transcriptional regulator YafY